MTYYYTFDISGAYIGWSQSSVDVSHETTDIPPLPTFYTKPIWNGSAWIMTVKSELVQALADAIKAKQDSVNAERDKRLEAIIVLVNGHPYNGDKISRDNLQGVLSAENAGVPIVYPFDWRDANNAIVPLSKNDALTIAGGILASVQTIYTMSWHIKDVVIPNLAPDTVASFDITNDVLWQVPT